MTALFFTLSVSASQHGQLAINTAVNAFGQGIGDNGGILNVGKLDVADLVELAAVGNDDRVLCIADHSFFFHFLNFIGSRKTK